MRYVLVLFIAASCASQTSSQPAPKSEAPADVACEWHAGRCAYWHPCGEGPVGEGTCWDDCDPKRCR